MPETTQQSWKRLLMRKSVLWRAVLYSLLISTIVVSILTAISYFFSRTLVQQSVLEQLTTAASYAEERLQSELQRSRAQGVLSASLFTSQYGTKLDEVSREDIEEFTAMLRANDSSILAIHIYNAQGESTVEDSTIKLPSPPPQLTAMIPAISRTGWDTFDIISPLRFQGNAPYGWIVLVHDAAPFVERLMPSVALIGDSGIVEFGLVTDDQLYQIAYTGSDEQWHTLSVGAFAELLRQEDPLALAARGNEGLGLFTDHNGNKVIAAHRYLPDLGWGLVVKMSRIEASRDAAVLASTMVYIGALLLIVAIILGFSFAHRLVEPFIDISQKVSRLSPGHWHYQKTVHTHDEVEYLDRSVAVLSQRLRKMYEQLEEEVVERTEQLQEQSTKDRAILESLSFGLLVVDTKGVVIEANPAAAEILKRKQEDVKGTNAVSLLDIRQHQKKIAEQDNPILSCLKTHAAVHPNPNLHLTITCGDNTYLSARISVSPLIRDKKLLGAIILFQDVTTERQLDYMKTEFITLASHQLRTPLSTIQWYLELLSADDEERLSESQQSFLVELRLAAHRMVNIVAELMDASRLRQDGVSPVLKKVNLNQFIENITSDMKALSSKKNIRCVSKVPNEPVMLTTDPMLLSIVLQNLLSNAVKYSYENATVEVTLDQSGEEVAIIVTDHGMGIPRADQDRIFQKLFRAHNARKLEVNGSGLGLYSSRMIAEKLGGSIIFQSEEDKGSVFTVRFRQREEGGSEEKDAE